MMKIVVLAYMKGVYFWWWLFDEKHV